MAYFVDCQVSTGLFNSEFYVTVSGSSAFVNRRNVIVDEPPEKDSVVEGKVLAYMIDVCKGKDIALIEVPGEPVVGGLRTWIPKSALTSS